MKKQILNILCGLFLLMLVACGNNGIGDNSDDSKPDNSFVVNSRLISTEINHDRIDNTKNQEGIITIKFDQQELEAILKKNSKPNLKITAKIDDTTNLIILDESNFNKTGIVDNKIAPITAKISTTCKLSDGCGIGGMVNIKFYVNEVLQNNPISFMVSQRSVKFATDTSEHNQGGQYKIDLFAQNLTPGDSFNVELLPSGVTIDDVMLNGAKTEKKYCHFSSADSKCTITYTVGTKAPYSIGTKIGDLQTDATFNIVVCDGDPKLLFEVVGKDYIDLENYEVKFKLSKRCIDVSKPILVDLELLGNPIETEKKIADFIDLDKTVAIDAGVKEKEFVAKLKTQDAKEISLHLGANFSVVPTVDEAKYGKLVVDPTSRIIENKSNIVEPFIDIKPKEDISISAGNNTNFNVVTQHKITDLKFAVYKSVSDEPIDGKLLKIVKQSDDVYQIQTSVDLAVADDYRLKAKNGDNFIKINGKDYVGIHITPTLISLRMTPSTKNILKEFSSDYFYIKAEKMTTAKRVLLSQLSNKNDAQKVYLYSDQPDSDSCKDLQITKIKLDNFGNPVEDSKCSLQKADCNCDLTADGKDLSGSCIFKVETGNKYQADVACTVKMRTENDLGLGSAVIKSTPGRSAITLKVNTPDQNYDFKDAKKIEMWSSKSDGSTILNSHWFTMVNKENLNCVSRHAQGAKCIFDDEALLAKDSTDVSSKLKNYFAVDINNNVFIIKNYPGRNTLNIAVDLPKMYFIMGVHSDKTDNPWEQNNKCDVGSIRSPNLGCKEGGLAQFSHLLDKDDNDLRTYIPQGMIKIGADNNLSIVSGDIHLGGDWGSFSGNPVNIHTLSVINHYLLDINITRSRPS